MINNHPKNALIGLAVADALGVPVEFKSRDYLKSNPLREMIGYGTYSQPPGTWSDDSSLAFCLADSLTNGFSLKDMATKFIQWRRAQIWTPHGEVFDIGNTTRNSINQLNEIIESGREADLELLYVDANEMDNGNGSLMRILPLLFYIKGRPIGEQFDCIWQVSALTHKHIRSAFACLIYLRVAEKLMNGKTKEEAYTSMQKEVLQFFEKRDINPTERKHFDRILLNDISTYEESTIESKGYVMHSLEASLWCLLRYDTYKDTALAAVNLGEDTDTTAAIVGGLAGLLYGVKNIPMHWVALLARKQDIFDLADRLNSRYFAIA